MVVVSLAVTGPLNDGGGTSAGTGSASSQSGDGWTQAISIEVREGTKLAFDLSPDGRMIVFDLLGQLWLLPATGGEATPLTHAVRDQAVDRDPSFSTDGKWIAFRSSRPEGGGLWLISIGGEEIRQLTEQGGWREGDTFPAWSPTGRQIAFFRGFPQNEIYILDVDTGALRPLHIEGLPSPSVRDPAWSPDGTRLCFVNAGRFRASGGRIWEVGINRETATPLTAETVEGRAPVYSPDAKRIAFFSKDAQGRMQLWVQDLGGTAQKLTEHSDTTPLRVRWSPDGSALYYSADGRLWRMAATGGSPQAIPFTAKLSFQRKRPQLKPVRFAPPGVERPARGHRGLALSPDGKRIAMIALGKLWVWRADDKPRALAALPSTADGLVWSPDGQEVVFSAGLGGTEDLFATNVENGKTRRLTSLPGSETRPSWSPDGQHIAFLHEEESLRVRVIPAHGGPIKHREATLDVAQAPISWGMSHSQEVPPWSPDSKSILLFSWPDWPPGEGSRITATLITLEGKERQLERFPAMPTFLHWGASGAIVYIENNKLWRVRFSAEAGMLEEPAPLFDDAALYPSVARDGSILYVSDDGLRLRRSDGQLQHLGWPLSYRLPAPPEPMLIRNVRLITGKEDAPTELRDILVEGGRIARVAPDGEIKAKEGTRVIEAEGRVVMPGLIDLHTHMWDDVELPGLIYYGVTTVRDASSPIARTAALRDEVEAGLRAGPRIVFGGFQFLATDKSGPGLSGDTIQTPADGAGRLRALRLAHAFGAEYAKLYFPIVHSGAEFIEAAHTFGLPVSGHLALPLPLIAAGLDGKEHLGQSGDRTDGIIYNDVVQLFKAADLWVVPTIAVFSSIVRLIDEPSIVDQPVTAPFLSPSLRQFALRNPPARRRFWEPRLNWARLATKKLHEGGVTIAAGTDTPHLAWALHWELEELVRSGMSPSEAIHAATGIAARVLGADAEIGTIEDGKWADLVILDADPLQDIQNTKKIWMVIKGGVIVNRDALLHWIERETVRRESQEHLKP